MLQASVRPEEVKVYCTCPWVPRSRLGEILEIRHGLMATLESYEDSSGAREGMLTMAVCHPGAGTDEAKRVGKPEMPSRHVTSHTPASK